MKVQKTLITLINKVAYFMLKNRFISPWGNPVLSISELSSIYHFPHRKIIRSSGNPDEFIKGALFAFSVSSKQLPKPTRNSKPGTLAYYPHEIVAKIASLRNVANFLPQKDCYTNGYLGAIYHVIQISKGWPQTNTRGNGVPSSNILNAIEGADLLFTSEHSRRGLPIRKGARTALFAIRTHFELHTDESRAIRKRLYYELEKIRPGISQGRTEIEQYHTLTPTTEEKWRRMFAQFELPTEYPFGGFDDLFDMPKRASNVAEPRFCRA